jgi:hypothetical protein
VLSRNGDTLVESLQDLSRGGCVEEMCGGDAEIKARLKKIRVFVPGHGPTFPQRKKERVIGPGAPESGSSASGRDLDDGMREGGI